MFDWTDPSVVLAAKSFSPVPLGIQVTVILDKKPLLLKSFYFDLTWKQSLSQYFYPFCMLLGIWYSGSILSHRPFCYKNHGGEKKTHFVFWKCLMITRLTTCLLLSSLGAFQEFCHETYFQNGPTCNWQKEIQNKTRSGWGVCPSQSRLTWHVLMIWTNSNPFAGFRSAVKNATRPYIPECVERLSSEVPNSLGKKGNFPGREIELEDDKGTCLRWRRQRADAAFSSLSSGDYLSAQATQLPKVWC